MLWEHTPAATVPYLGLGAEISLVGYVLKTPPVGILDVPFSNNRLVAQLHSCGALRFIIRGDDNQVKSPADGSHGGYPAHDTLLPGERGSEP